MIKISKISAAFLATLFFISGSFANQTTLQQGWQAFNSNKAKEAQEYLKQAASDADTKAEAYLALALVYWNEDKTKESFTAFQNFFSATDNPYPYLYALWTSPVIFEGYDKKNDEQLKFLRKLNSESKTNGTISAMVHSMLGKHFEAIGDFKKAEDEFAQIGAINNWQVLGSFDNTSGSGFNKDYGVLTNPQADAVFKNKVNADVMWFTPSFSRSDRWFDFNYYFVIESSVMYAQTFLKSETDQDVYFRSGNSGSLKIWVNDKLVTNIADERNCDLDIYINNVKLNKGYNRILVQIGESETNAANFMIRVTDKDGNVIKGLTASPAQQPYSKAGEYAVTSQGLFAEDFF
jgi:tetratricopeptide (TPR) repeat protein